MEFEKIKEEVNEINVVIELCKKVFKAFKDTITRLVNLIKRELQFFWACAKNPRLVELAKSKKKRTSKKNFNRLMKIAYKRKKEVTYGQTENKSNRNRKHAKPRHDNQC